MKIFDEGKVMREKMNLGEKERLEVLRVPSNRPPYSRDSTRLKGKFPRSSLSGGRPQRPPPLVCFVFLLVFFFVYIKISFSRLDLGFLAHIW